MHESCSTCRAEFICSARGNTPPTCVINPDDSLLSWSPWTNEEVSTISDQFCRICNYSHRLRIAHLRRMADAAAAWGILSVSASECVNLSKYDLTVRKVERIERFHSACLTEIARLRGEK